MSDIVIDSSVAIPLFVPEPTSLAVRASFSRWRAEGHRLLVPGHFWLEVLNRIGRSSRLPSDVSFESIREIDELGLETVHLERPHHLLIAALMERHGLTSYDAAYLALAEITGAMLATFDRELTSAAGGRWVNPLGPSASHRLSEVQPDYGSQGRWPGWPGAGAYLGELRRRALAGER